MIDDTEKLRRTANGLAALIQKIEQIEGCRMGPLCLVKGGEDTYDTGRREPVCGCCTDAAKMRRYTLYVDTYLRGLSRLLWGDDE